MGTAVEPDGYIAFGNGNIGGAAKLYRSSRDYMAPCGSPFLGLDTAGFWREMDRCFAPLLGASPPARSVRPDPELLPRIALDPPPDEWPDPAAYLHDEG